MSMKEVQAMVTTRKVSTEVEVVIPGDTFHVAKGVEEAIDITLGDDGIVYCSYCPDNKTASKIEKSFTYDEFVRRMKILIQL